MAVFFKKSFKFNLVLWATIILLLCLLTVVPAMGESTKANEGVTEKNGDSEQGSAVKSIEKKIFDPDEPLPESNEGPEPSYEDENEAASHQFNSGPAPEIDEQLKGTGLMFNPFVRGGVSPDDMYDNTGQR
jgi:hypothetical protein